MRLRFLFLFLFSVATASFSQTLNLPLYTLPDHSTLSFLSSGEPQLKVGYARIQGQNRIGSYGLPFGMAICSLHQNGVLVSEVSIPASPLISSGRIYAEIAGPVDTGIAIANPNNQSANIDFYFTDSSGNTFGQGSTTVGANKQIATFLNQPPFNLGGSLRGTFTFTSSSLVSATGIRAFVNERNEFLMAALPLATVGTNVPPSAVTVPHFADGGGWTTSLVLVNPTDAAVTGTFTPYAQSGQPVTLTLNGKATSIFDYSVPPRSCSVFVSAGTQSEVQVGSIRVDPNAASSGVTVFAIFGYSANGVRVTEAAAQANGSGGSVMSVFVESEGNFGAPGSIQSGIAVTNSGPVDVATSVHFELYRSDGTQIGISQNISVPAHWQSAMFLSQIQGLPSIPSPFKGILRIVASANRFSLPGISVTGLRARFNERGEFLVTTTPPISEVFATTSPELLFPHFAIGGDYSSEFVLFSDDGATGSVYFYDQSGTQISPTTLTNK